MFSVHSAISESHLKDAADGRSAEARVACEMPAISSRKRPLTEREQVQADASSTAAASSSSAAEPEIQQFPPVAHAAAVGSRSRAAAKARLKRATKDAQEARKRAGLVEQEKVVLDEDDAAETEPDDLAELLEVLYHSEELGEQGRNPVTKAPFVGVQNAAELATLLKQHAGWFDGGASKPISLARIDGGGMSPERLLDLISEPEQEGGGSSGGGRGGGSSSGCSGSGGGGRPAQMMRRAAASRHWELGKLDDASMSLTKLDELMKGGGKKKINDRLIAMKTEEENVKQDINDMKKNIDERMTQVKADQDSRSAKMSQYEETSPNTTSHLLD